MAQGVADILLLRVKRFTFSIRKMQYNNSVWVHYQPGFIDPMYVPYQGVSVKGTKIYPFKKQGECAEPVLVRKNWGMRFQPQYDNFPCPYRWKKDSEGFCVEDRPLDSRFYLQSAPNYYLKTEKPVLSPHSLQNISFDLKTGERKEYIKGKKSPTNKIIREVNYYC